jgi:hypothetical protein
VVGVVASVICTITLATSHSGWSRVLWMNRERLPEENDEQSPE